MDMRHSFTRKTTDTKISQERHLCRPWHFLFHKVLLLLAAVQSKKLPAGLLTFVNNLISSTGLQMKLLENLVHLHPCKLHGYNIAVTLINRFQMLKQARQLLFVRLIILLTGILVVDTDFFSQLGKDDLRIITLILTLMDTALTTIALRAVLR